MNKFIFQANDETSHEYNDDNLEQALNKFAGYLLIRSESQNGQKHIFYDCDNSPNTYVAPNFENAMLLFLQDLGYELKTQAWPNIPFQKTTA